MKASRQRTGSTLASALVLLCALCGSAGSQTPTPAATPEVHGAAWFLRHHQNRVAQFEAENATISQSSAEQNVILLGDSLTEGWALHDRAARFLPGWRIVNRGISADTVGRERGVLGRLDASVFDCNPSHVFLLIGINDLADLHRDGAPSVEEIWRDYRAIVEQIRTRRPDVVLTLITLPPTGAQHAYLIPMIVDFNRRIGDLAREAALPLIDLYPLLADEEGQLRADLTGGDGLHWTDAAYARLSREIDRVLRETDAQVVVPDDLRAWFPHAQERLLQFRGENAALAAASPEERHVVLLGSSTMEGWKNRDRVARFLPRGFRYLNRGIAADRIGVGETGILHRLEESVFACNPTHVFIQNGTNDLMVLARQGSPSVEAIAATYRRVVETIQERLPEVVVGIVTVQPLRGNYAIGNAPTLEFNERLRQIAADLGCHLIDHHPMLTDAEGLLREDLTSDGLHFSDEGYRMMGEEIARVLRETTQGLPEDAVAGTFASAP